MTRTVSSNVPTIGRRPAAGRRRLRRGRDETPTAAVAGHRNRRDDLIDLGAGLALTGIAVTGFLRTFDGLSGPLVGTVGALAGLAAAWIAARLRLSPITTLALSVAALVLAAGPAVPDHSLVGFLPGPAVPGALLDGLVHGWKDLVTTAPPAGLDDGLGVVPYATGFGAALGAALVALRTRQPLLPAAAPSLALAIAIVLGDHAPVSVLLQGGIFVVLALAWAAVRANRTRRSVDGTIYWPRIRSGALMLAAVGGGGLVLGGGLPFVTPGDRYVARDHVIPPFDPRDYPSPLAAFRQYRLAQKEDVLFTVDGLPEGARIRLAAMDAYDGIVWIVSGSEASGAGRFERVGNRVMPVPSGGAIDLDVTIGAYENVWMPSVGSMRSARFVGNNRADLQAAFRYNRATGTGATPIRLLEGDRYELTGSVPAEITEEVGARQSIASVSLPALPDDEGMATVLDMLQERAIEIAGGEQSPYEQLRSLEGYFQRQAFSDGGPEATGRAQVNSGHSLAAVGAFIDADQTVGNGEHYAATMALMARQLGLPARVVVGFAPEGAGRVEVLGSDADAWVEVAFSDIGWVPFYPTPPEENEPEEEEKQSRVEDELSTQEPQEDPYLEPPDEVEEIDRRNEVQEPPAVDERRATGFRLPRLVEVAIRWGGPPVGVILAVAASIVGVKAFRRRRRRTRGTEVQRAAGAWQELVDLLRDRGVGVVAGTRREVAASSSDVWGSGPVVARRFDEVMFGPAPVTETEVAELWGLLDSERTLIDEPLTRRQRLRAAVSVASLRRPPSTSRRARPTPRPVEASLAPGGAP